MNVKNKSAALLASDVRGLVLGCIIIYKNQNINVSMQNIIKNAKKCFNLKN